jgi:hypothetical protein
MVVFTSDQWIILALVFVLGLLVGAFLFAGSGRKWKHRYRSEVDRREAIEREHAEHHRQFDDRERQWREQDSLRAAAIRDNRDSDADRPL